MAATSRDYQVIIFGATGFTGTLTAEYLAEHPAAKDLKWAIAGRNSEKLAALANSLEQHSPHGVRPGIVTADISDPGSLTAMTEQAEIVVTTVGPYVDYGIPVVQACVATGTHYLDITGEPEFWYRVIKEFDDAAKAQGVKLISCCGFDSIPADIGTYYTLSKLSEKRPATVRSYFRAKGAASGGTWASLLEAFGRARDFAEQRRRENKSAKKSPSGKSKANLIETLRDQFPLQHADEVDAWVLPMPTIDPSIVKRSASIDDAYGESFQYDQYLQVGSAAQGAAILTGVAGLFAMAQFKPSREWLKSMRPSGEGPDDEERAENWFEVTYVGENADGVVRCSMKGGDPGYGETSKMLSECALCLALDTETLPERSGVLTTASAMGDCLVGRLQEAGIVFEANR